MIYEDNVHQIKYTNFTATRCEIGVHIANGTNAGERITFAGGTMNDSTLNILMECASGNMKLTNVSLDYSDQFVRGTGDCVFITGEHVDGKMI